MRIQILVMTILRKLDELDGLIVKMVGLFFFFKLCVCVFFFLESLQGKTHLKEEEKNKNPKEEEKNKLKPQKNEQKQQILYNLLQDQPKNRKKI